MSSNKYGKLLTVIIVIAILGIVGLLVFLGIDIYNKYYLEKEASQGVEQFDRIIANRVTENNTTKNDLIVEIDNNTVENETTENVIVNPYADVPEEPSTDTQKPANNGVVYYKGFVQKGTISIPKTGLNCPVLEKASKKAIEVAVGIQVGPGLNEVGNTIIAGHNYHNGLFFSNNKNIQVGDKIYIKDTSGRTVTYIVYNKFETTPEDTSYINKDTNGKREITLYTCSNVDRNKRLIIEAKEQ